MFANQRGWVRNFLFLIFFAVPFTAGIILINGINSDLKQRLITSFNSQQRTLVEQADRRIQDFFSHYKKVLRYLASLPAVQSGSFAMRIELERLYHTYRGSLHGVTRMDNRGRILYTVPWNRSFSGVSIEYQPHVKKLLATRKPVVSEVFRAVQGFRTVAYHYPVFHNGSFSGSVVLLLPFEQITRSILSSLTIGSNGYAWMIDSGGIELYCPVPGHVGRHVNETCKEYPSILRMTRSMMAGESGTTVYRFNRLRGSKVYSLNKQAVYRSVALDGNFWSIVMATPEEDILSNLSGLKGRLVGLGLLLFAGAGVAFGLLMRSAMQKKELRARRILTDRLAESESRLRVTLRSIGDAVVTTDMQGRITGLNPVAEELLGVSSKSAAGLPLTDCFQIRNSLTGARAVNPVEAVISQGVKVGLANHTELISAQGTVYQISDSAAPIVDDAGRQLGVVLVFRDVSGEYLQQRQLQESEEKFRLLFEYIPSGVVFYSARGDDFVISRMNPAAAAIEQVNRDEVTGHRVTEVFPGVRQFGLLDIFQQVLKQGQPVEFPLRFYKDKRISGWRENFVFPLPSGEVVAVYRDVTAQKTAEQQVLLSEKKFRSYVDNAPDGIFVVNSEGVYVDSNPAAAEMTGFDKQHLIGSHLAEYIYEEDRPAALAHFHSLQESGAATGEFRYVTKAGEVRWWTVTAVALSDNQFLGFVKDVTDRKIDEKNLRTSLLEKETLIKEVHHRVKNNMQVISSLLQLQTGMIRDPFDMEMFQETRSRIQAMTMVHEKLYREESLAELDSTLFIDSLVRDIEQMYSINSSSIQVEQYIEPGIALDISRAVPCALILHELMTNVFKYAYPEGARGRAEVRLTVTAEKECLLTVADEGKGFPDSYPFDEPVTLGMQLVQALTKQLHGQVDFKVQGGTTVTVRFPLD